MKKIEEALRRIQLGLLANTGLNTDSLMMFVYGVVNDSFAALKGGSGDLGNAGRKINFDEEGFKREEKRFVEQSCLLIPIEPKRRGDKPKVQSKTNQHFITEFALQVKLHFSLL